MIENKIAKSGLITLNLEKALPRQADLKAFDLEPFLFRGLILREKEFRQAMKELDWSAFEGKAVAIFCSADAIVPMWSYMLVSSYLEEVADFIAFGTIDDLYSSYLRKKVAHYLATHALTDQRVIIKGCGQQPIPPAAYVEATRILRPIVKSLFFGEACSTVPVYKQNAKK